MTTRSPWQFTICTTTNDLTLYSFSWLYIFVTSEWPTVAETCRQANRTYTNTVVLAYLPPSKLHKTQGDDASKDTKAFFLFKALFHSGRIFTFIVIIIIIIIFLHVLGRLTCSGIDALSSFPGASTISSSSRFLVEGVFRESGVVRSFKVVDPVLSVLESHVMYSRDLQFIPCDFASYFIQPCVSRNTSYKAHLCSF